MRQKTFSLLEQGVVSTLLWKMYSISSSSVGEKEPTTQSKCQNQTQPSHVCKEEYNAVRKYYFPSEIQWHMNNALLSSYSSLILLSLPWRIGFKFLQLLFQLPLCFCQFIILLNTVKVHIKLSSCSKGLRGIAWHPAGSGSKRNNSKTRGFLWNLNPVLHFSNI